MRSLLKKTEDLTLLARQMATCLNAGISPQQALKHANSRAFSRPLQQGLEQAVEALAKGQTFSQCLAPCAHVLPNYTIPFVAAGESSGHADEAFDYLEVIGRQLLPILRIARQIWLIPLAIIAFGALLRLAIILYLGANEAALQSVIDVGVKLGSLGLAGIVLRRTHFGKRLWDRMMVSFPYVGNMHRAISFGLFFQGFKFLYRTGGQDISSILRMALNAVPNTRIQDDLQQILPAIQNNQTLSEAFHAPTLLDDETRQSLSSAALVGRLEEALDRVTRVQAEQLESQLHFVKSILARLLGFAVIGSIYSTILLYI